MCVLNGGAPSLERGGRALQVRVREEPSRRRRLISQPSARSRVRPEGRRTAWHWSACDGLRYGERTRERTHAQPRPSACGSRAAAPMTAASTAWRAHADSEAAHAAPGVARIIRRVRPEIDQRNMQRVDRFGATAVQCCRRAKTQTNKQANGRRGSVCGAISFAAPYRLRRRRAHIWKPSAPRGLYETASVAAERY